MKCGLNMVRYFKLGQDRRMPYGVLLTGINHIEGYYEARKGDAARLNDAIASFVNPSPLNFYPDILDRQIFMIKNAVKEVFDLFLPGLEYKHCCLIDKTNDMCEQYSIPMLGVTGLEAGIEDGRHIFRFAGGKEIETAVSFEAAETLLLCKPAGVRITPLVNVTGWLETANGF